MTANQIRYAQHRETQRANRASEAIGRHQAESSRISALASESQADTARRRMEEEARHNLKQEAVNWFSAYQTATENQRHNRATEEVNWFTARSEDTTRRSQAQSAAQQAQASLRHAEAAMASAGAAQLQAQAGLLNAQTNAGALSESIRHNTALEMEATRHNTAVEKETNRSNEVNEVIRRRQAGASESQAKSSRINAYANVAGKVIQGFDSALGKSILGGFLG